MKQNTYRLIASILIFVLTLIFVGCNGGTEPTVPSTMPTGTNPQTQGTTAPETSVPGTSAPETTVPETTVPATTVPETTAPETTVPGTSAPETTAPETTVPETTVPETTVPETTVPETTAPVETQPTVTEPPVTEPPVTEPEEVVYVEADVANSVELLESRLHNWPEFGDNQTAMTQFTWNYIIYTKSAPVCNYRSVEVISAKLGGIDCTIYQAATPEKAWAILKKYDADFVVTTQLLTVTQIISPEVAMDRNADCLDMVFEVILRCTLENGQVMDLRYTDDVVWFGSGGVLMDCKPEDFL